MNVTKMRHQVERNTERAEEAEHRLWLARMTPEHRAIHVGPFPRFCGECLSRSMQALFPATRRTRTTPELDV